MDDMAAKREEDEAIREIEQIELVHFGADANYLDDSTYVDFSVPPPPLVVPPQPHDVEASGSSLLPPPPIP